jgi:hypothetical protein
MNDEVIKPKQSRGPDLLGVEAALQRAAQRARERARATGTRLVVSRNGVLEFIPPEHLAGNSQEVAEQAGRYGEQE